MKFKIFILFLLFFWQLGCERINGNRVELLTLDYNHLLEVRNGIQEKSPIYLEAYQRLIKEAENILNQSCYTVVDKSTVPPSGDKKDYMSLATYWWPDPEKADGLPYIRKDGYRNPEGDKENYDDRRSSRMVDDVVTLTLAWFYSNDSRYAGKAADMIDTWYLNPETGMNPNLNFGQAIPGRVEGRGIGIIDTRNYIMIVDAARLLEKSPAWSKRNSKSLQQWFSEYIAWLQESEYGKDEEEHLNNHGTWYDVQLAWYASYTGNNLLVKDIVNNAKTRRIDRQIDSLGRQEHELDRTKSFTYSVFNLEALILLGKIGEMNGIDLWTHESPQKGSIKKACDYIFSFIENSEEWPYQQISPVPWDRLTSLLTACCEIFNDPEYDRYLQKLQNDIKSNDRLLITKL